MSNRRRIPRPRRELAGLPPLPDRPPAHVIAFMDQVAAGMAAGDLPAGTQVHLDVLAPLAGALVAEVLPRLCAAPVGVRCGGEC